MSQLDSKFTMSIREPIKITLQKEIEVAISQYEEARHQEMHLDQKIKELEQELEKIKSKKKAEQNPELVSKCLTLQKKLEVSQTHVNTIQGENQNTRTKINHLRIVTASYKNKVKSLETDIHKSKILAKIKNEEQTKEKDQEKEKLSEIRLAMSKSANEKLRYTQKLEAISSIMKQEKNNNTQTLKKLNENLDGILNRKLKILDNTKLIGKLCERIESEINKISFKITKRKQHNTKLEELFCVVKNHSNIKTEAEFVDVFLNFYEESSDLSKYLLEVLAEIESLEYANKKIEGIFEESNQLLLTSRSKANKIYSELSQNMKKTYLMIHNSIKHQSLIKDQLDRIKIWLSKSLALGNSLNLNSSTSLSVESYNIEDYLSVLEELIYSIRIYKLYTQKKDFLVKHITLSPVNSNKTGGEINVIET